MREIIVEFFTNLGSKLAVLLLAGTTAITTGSAVVRLVSKPDETQASEWVLGAEITPVSETMRAGGKPIISPTPTLTITTEEKKPEKKSLIVVTTTSPTVTPTITTGTGFVDDDDREDKEHEDRYIEEKEDERRTEVEDIELEKEER